MTEEPKLEARDDKGDRIIHLDQPIYVNNKPVDTLTMRRPKARDLRTFDQAAGGDMAKMFILLEALTNVPESSLDEMDIDDFAKVMGVLQGFTEKFQQIGGALSD
jgi:hypothetical protein